MNRQQRRRVEALHRHFANSDMAIAADRASLVRLVAVLVEADETMSGATIVMPDGELSYVDAEMLRRGGAA